MFSDIINFINDNLQNFLGRNYLPIISTVFLIITLFAIYSFSSYLIKKMSWKMDKKRKVAMNVRNSMAFYFILSLIFIWSGELKTMILTITALVAAMLIAYKEVFLSLAGSFFAGSSRLFALGEYIEVDNIRGKVIDKNFIYTKVLVSDSFQTRELNIPNILFITGKVTNLSKFGKLQSFTLSLTVPSLSKVREFSSEVERLAQVALEDQNEKYSEYFNEKKKSDIFFEMPAKYYSVDYDLSDSRNPLIKLHYLAHPLNQKTIEHKIYKQYILKLEEMNNDDKKKGIV